MSLGDTSIAEIACRAGFDWVCVDLEHSAVTLERAAQLIQIIDRSGSAPLVRLSSNDPVQIKRVMDAGAHGIIVPMVNSQADVAAAHAAMHYPPTGTRGVGLSRAQAWGPGFDEYREWLSTSAVLVAQIEHQDAMAALDEILGDGRLDAAMIGPYDLTASMGIAGQFDHPRYHEALEAFRAGCELHGVAAGIHVVEPDRAQLDRRLAEGYRFVAYSVDFRMVEAAMRAGLDGIR